MKSSPETETGTKPMPDDYQVEHFRVLERANRIYVEKSQIRGQMWLEWPPSDKIRELRERVMRIESAYWERSRLIPPEPGPESPHIDLQLAIVEDALDMINYAAFLIKQLERGMSG